MILVGLVILALVGGVSAFDYVGYLKRRAAEYAALARLSDAVRIEIETFSASPRRIAEDISARSDAEIKARAHLLESPDGIFDAPIERGDAERVHEFLTLLGRSDRDGEIRKARSIAEHLNKKGREEAERLDAKIRVCRLIYATALACALMLAA